jgi:hypothetical protein
MTDFERLIQRVQARRVVTAYNARGLDLPATVAEILVDDTPERHAADNAAWRQWGSHHGLPPILCHARDDTVLTEGDPEFDAIWRCEWQERGDGYAAW